MHELEPFYNWRDLYLAEEDEKSPFFGKEYSEFEYSDTIYNYYIHPHWDNFGSHTLYCKILFADYDFHFVIIELMGEWNDAIEDDFMTLKKEVLDILFESEVYKYILIGENVLNFHSGDEDYYDEWQEELSDENGWAVLLNLPEQSRYDFDHSYYEKYFRFLTIPQWRTYNPVHLFQFIDHQLLRLQSGE